MKVISKKDQLQGFRFDIEVLMDWQGKKILEAKKRYTLKSKWGFLVFWIDSNTRDLFFAIQKEEKIWNELRDYRNELIDKLNDLEYE